VTLGTTAPTDILPLAPGLNNGWIMALPGMQYGTAILAAVTTTPTGSTAPTTAVNYTFATIDVAFAGSLLRRRSARRLDVGLQQLQAGTAGAAPFGWLGREHAHP
jgi:hypothetical protein